MSLATYCPSSVNCGAIVPAFLLIGDLLVFLLLVIDLRLLQPRRYTVLFWASPLLYGYLLLSLVGGVFLEALNGTFTSVLYLAASVAAILLGLLAGVGAGRVIGRRMRIGKYADGKKWFQGGRRLVALLWVCLLPRAVVSGVDLLNLASVSGVNAFVTTPPFLLLDVLSGALAVLVAALTVTWKSRVSVRFFEMH